MCGIAGVLYRDPHRPVEQEVLKAMADAIAHRGPDDEGYYSEPGVGLAHRRLSIIDLQGGRQPLGSEDGQVQVVFNGEIYNYRQLRDRLRGRGHRFASDTDTEVLVHLYEEEGECLVDRLRGMFAFALWDAARRRLLLARDRVGLKPLYVYRDAEKLLFGSELKAILAHPEVERQVDPAALEDYLAFGVVPGRRAIFRRMEKLPPGHVVTFSVEDKDPSPRRYWRYQPAIDPRRSTDDWCTAVLAKLDETVSAHTVADVEVGAFLSGGIDSSAVVASLAGEAGVSPQTFSIGMDRGGESELPYARQVAQRYGCRHHEDIVTPEAATALEDLVHYFDEPFADSSAIPTLMVSRLARRHVKVVLSGDGGDEAFGGYHRYVHDLKEARLRRLIPQWCQTALVAPLAAAWPRADWLPRPLRLNSLLTNLSLPGDEAYAHTLSICCSPLRRTLLADDIAAQLNSDRSEDAVIDPYRSSAAGDPLSSMIAADVGMLLPDDFLTKVDRASMACGLEVRPPLVDHELLQLAGSIPSKLKVRRGTGKWIFKRALSDRVPRRILRRRKQGFEIPTDRWLRGPLRDMFESTVLDRQAPVGQWINADTAERLYRQHLSGVGRHGNTLWALLVLARWTETYLRAPSASPLPAGAGQKP